MPAHEATTTCNNLKPGEAKALTEIWEYMDANHDGGVTCEELSTAIKGTQSEELSKSYMETIDKNKNARIELDEWLEFWDNQASAENPRGVIIVAPAINQIRELVGLPPPLLCYASSELIKRGCVIKIMLNGSITCSIGRSLSDFQLFCDGKRVNIAALHVSTPDEHPGWMELTLTHSIAAHQDVEIHYAGTAIAGCVGEASQSPLESFTAKVGSVHWSPAATNGTMDKKADTHDTRGCLCQNQCTLM